MFCVCVHVCVCVCVCRVVDKTQSRHMLVERASRSVTELIFQQQSAVKQKFLEQISLVHRHERDVLRQWRKLILHNTHPRCV